MGLFIKKTFFLLENKYKMLFIIILYFFFKPLTASFLYLKVSLKV